MDDNPSPSTTTTLEQVKPTCPAVTFVSALTGVVLGVSGVLDLMRFVLALEVPATC